MNQIYFQIASCLLDKAHSLASTFQDDPAYQTVDENGHKTHNRKPSNGVQKQNKIISPVKHIERMATSGSFTNLRENSQRKSFNTRELCLFNFVLPPNKDTF